MVDREDPQNLFSVHYSGELAEGFWIEAQYGQRDHAWGAEVDQDLESVSEPASAPIPTTVLPEPEFVPSRPPPLPVSEPGTELPIILVPVDNEDVGKELEDKGKQKGPYRKQEPVTIVNPLLYNVSQTPLRQPPVGKVVEPILKPQKTYHTKAPKIKEPKQKIQKTLQKQPEEQDTAEKVEETSEDEIKKLLNKYMK